MAAEGDLWPVLSKPWHASCPTIHPRPPYKRGKLNLQKTKEDEAHTHAAVAKSGGGVHFMSKKGGESMAAVMKSVLRVGS